MRSAYNAANKRKQAFAAYLVKRIAPGVGIAARRLLLRPPRDSPRIGRGGIIHHDEKQGLDERGTPWTLKLKKPYTARNFEQRSADAKKPLTARPLATSAREPRKRKHAARPIAKPGGWPDTGCTPPGNLP